MRWLWSVIGGLVVLALVAAGALLLVPSDQIARLLARQIEKATGADVSIGEARASIWPETGVSMTEVSILVPGTTEPILEAADITVSVDPVAFWGGEVRVRSIAMDSPVIRLRRYPDGSTNWALPAGAPPAETEPATAPGTAAPAFGGVALDEGTIRDGIVRYTDETTAQEWSATDLDMTVALSETGGAEIEASFETAETPVSLTASIDALGSALLGQIAGVTFAAESAESTAAFEGRAGFAPMAAEGTIVADLAAPGALARRFGVAFPDLPAGFGRDRLSVAGTVTWTADRSLHLRGGKIGADDNVLTGDLDLVPGERRPKLTARLAAGALTFAPAAAADGGDAPASPAAASWSSDAIDASALGLLDAEVRLDAASLTQGGFVFAPLRGRLTIERARGVVELGELGLLGGTVTGQMVANNRDGLSVAADLTAQSTDIGVLAGAIGFDRLKGTGSARLKVLGVGNSVAAIMESLEGEGSLGMPQAEVLGIDLGRALGQLDPEAIGTDARTPIDDLSASFTIRDGILTNNDLALSSAALQASGRGIVDLGGRTLDYSLVPVATAIGNDLRVPLRITGPWDAPRVRLDAEALAAERLRIEEEKVKARLKAEEAELKARLETERQEAEARAAEELGVAPGSGESLEDAARRRLEEEAARGLERILRGN